MPDLAVVVIIVGSALAFGSVHAWSTAGLAVAAAAVGLLRLWRRRPLSVGWTGWALVAVMAGSLLGVVPLPEAVRAWVQPDLVALGATGWRPLAVDPRGAALGVGLLAGLSLLGLGLSARPLRSGWTAAAVVAAGAAVVAAHLVGFGWDEGGFGPLRNPNHAAVLLAVGASVAAERRQVLWWVVAVALVAAAAWTGSRAGLGLAVAGVVLAGISSLSGRARWVGIGAAAAVAIAVAGTAPWWFDAASEALAPGSTNRGWLGGREVLYGEAWRAIGLSPLGAGPGGYAVLQPIVKVSPDWARASHVHADPLEALVTFGPVLAAVGFAALGGLAWRGAGRRLVPLVVLGGAALVGFPLHVGLLAAVGVVLLARIAPTGRGSVSARWAWLGVVPVAVGVLVWLVGTGTYGVAPSREALTEATCAEAIAAHPLDGRVRLQCASKLQDLEARLAAVRLARQLDPTHPLAAWTEARALRTLGRRDEAAQVYVEALTFDLPPRPADAVWLKEALAVDREGVVAGLVHARPERLCANLGLVPGVDLDALAGRSARCALHVAERVGTAEPERAIAWLDGWPDDCGRQKLGARLALQLGRPAEALRWLQPAGGVCILGDAEVGRLREEARGEAGIR